MKKKVLLIVGVAIFFLAGAYFAFSKISNKTKTNSNQPLDSSNNSNLANQNTSNLKQLLWEDPAGYTFSYPDDNWKFDTHEQDVANYSNIEITKLDKPGTIGILVSDAKYKQISDWATRETILVGSQLLDTTVGGRAAKKALLEDGSLIYGVIDEGVLYFLVLKGDTSGYWANYFDQVIASFKFVYPTNYQPAGGSQTGSAGGSGTIVEEEEVVE